MPLYQRYPASMTGLQLKAGVCSGAGPTPGNQRRHVENDLAAQRTCHSDADQVCGEGKGEQEFVVAVGGTINSNAGTINPNIGTINPNAGTTYLAQPFA